MTMELSDRQAKALKEWLDDYAEWLRETHNCMPDYADRKDLEAAEGWCRRATEIRRFVSRHWPSEHVTVSVRTKTRRRS